jgi:hypothetical protein
MFVGMENPVESTATGVTTGADGMDRGGDAPFGGAFVPLFCADKVAIAAKKTKTAV